VFTLSLRRWIVAAYTFQGKTIQKISSFSARITNATHHILDAKVPGTVVAITAADAMLE
jgi:hypothetical protein